MTDRHFCSGAFILLLLSSPAVAQSVQQPPPLRLGEHLLNLPTARTLPDRTWDVRFTHRFAQPLNEGDARSLWGLDGAADIGLGLAYGIRENLQVMVFRSDVLDNFELSAKYAIRQQSSTFPVALAGRTGVNWKTERALDRKVSAFVQVVISRQVTPRLELFAVPSWSGRGRDYDSAANLPLGAAWAIRPNLFLVAELIPENRDAPAALNPGLAWAVGMKRAQGGHFFEVLVTDSRATHVDEYVASISPGGMREKNVHLGFNIGRRFGRR